MDTTPVHDDELSLIANGWQQMQRGYWSHPLLHDAGRRLLFTLASAVLQDAQLAAPDYAPAAGTANVPWCGVTDHDPED